MGQACLGAGRFDDAKTAFEKAIAAAPTYAEAHNNLGCLLLRQGKPQDAESAFRRALQAKPNYVQAISNLGAALGELERLDEAAAFCRQAIAARPDNAEAHSNMGYVLQKQGRLEEAETHFKKALALKPDFREARQHLGVLLCESHRPQEGLVVFNELARMKEADAPASTFPAHKLRHDAEQRAWLGETAAQFHLGDGSRISGAAVNPTNKVSEINALWRSARPQIVVIDDLLTPEALGKLRRFCLDSTVWRQVYDGGYLGAFPEHGFAPPLLAQIAEELRAVYPAIIEDYPLLHFWAFKYDSSLHGIKKHADFAAVNVNFWITPDEANLDPDHGGLVVWDAAAPLDWNFAKYNAAEDDITSFLTAQNSKPVTIPYRANRAVIFDSDLFHETDQIAFKEGYLNRRINITMLYGTRESAAK
jgi:Tfp pilus assembly protein PilF